jgi:hypothetical protein
LAHDDRPRFSGRPSLTGHCGHGWTCSLPRPVAFDTPHSQEGTVKKGLHRPRLNAIIPILTAAALVHIVRRRQCLSQFSYTSCANLALALMIDNLD